jgi:hypothetical protein
MHANTSFSNSHFPDIQSQQNPDPPTCEPGNNWYQDGEYRKAFKRLLYVSSSTDKGNSSSTALLDIIYSPNNVSSYRHHFKMTLLTMNSAMKGSRIVCDARSRRECVLDIGMHSNSIFAMKLKVPRSAYFSVFDEQ